MTLPEPSNASASNEAGRPTPSGAAPLPSGGTAPTEPVSLAAAQSHTAPPTSGGPSLHRHSIGQAAVEAVFLDLDDTLWPLEPSMQAAEQALRDWMTQRAPATGVLLDGGRRAELRAQVLIDHPQRRHDMSFTREELLRRALAEAGDDETLAPEAFAVFIAARRRVTPYPEVEAVLAQWSRRYAIVAVSNGNADVMQTSLGRFFTAAVNPEKVGAAKPDPSIFLHACTLAGVPPERALHIGDDPELDLIGARRAGLQGAWLLRPELAHRHPIDACGDWHPEPFPDLRAIDRLLGA